MSVQQHRTREEILTTGAEYQNMLSRSAIHPVSAVQKLQVPEDMVPWQVDFISKFKFLVIQIRSRM